MALRTAADVHRSLDLEEPPLVVQRTYSRGVEERAGRLVRQDGAVIPAVPQPLHDVDEFVRNLVTQLVLHVPFAAEIQRRLAGGAGHHVPCGAAVADVIDRREGAGDVIGLAKAGRDGRAETDASRGGAQHRYQRGGLEAAEKGGMISRVHDEPVGDEQQVEPATLGDAGNLLDDDKLIVAGRGPFVPPAGGMVAGAKDEDAEMHLTVGGTHSGRSPSLGFGAHAALALAMPTLTHARPQRLRPRVPPVDRVRVVAAVSPA
jgi:hypothetical protein